MVIVEILGSISLAIAIVSAITLLILYVKNKQNDLIYKHNYQINNSQKADRINNNLQNEMTNSVLPFEKFNMKKKLSVINVIDNDKTFSSSSIKYGIQWKIPSSDQEIQSVSNKTSEFNQGDSLSFSDQMLSVRNLIKKFENNSLSQISHKEIDDKNLFYNQTDSDLTSLDTNFDNRTIRKDFNDKTKEKYSHHSSISNLDVTIPSNLSSSIDLEHFECLSSTSNLSEYLNNNNNS